MLRRENLIACRSRRNRRRRRTTAGIGWSRPTPLMVRSRLYSITSILPRNRSVNACVHGSTRSGCQSLSRNRTIVMVHLLSRLGFVFRLEPLDRLERSSPGYGPGASPATLERQGTAIDRPGDRRLADVRHAVCRRVLHPPPFSSISLWIPTFPATGRRHWIPRWRREVASRVADVAGSRLRRDEPLVAG